jgi:hypothetical protein
MTSSTLTYHCPHCQSPVTGQPNCADNVVTCPACAKPFKLDVPVAKPEETPAALVLPPGTEPIPEAPPAVPVTAEEPETVGERIQLSMWRRYPLRCAGYAALTMIGFVTAILFLTQGWNILAGLFALGTAFVAWRGVTWWLRMHNTSLTITNRRCVIETGVFSREATEFGRKDVVDVHVSQTPVMRILNVGDLVIRSNNGTEKQIVVMAVPDPENVARKISVAPPPVAEVPAVAEATSAA